VPLLEDRDALVRLSAVVALPRLWSDRPALVAALEKAAADTSPAVRRRAAVELADLGAGGPAAIAALREGLSDTIPALRIEAAAKLARISSSEERPGLVSIVAAYLRDRDEDVRMAAVARLSGLGADGVPHLVAVVRDEAQPLGLRRRALRALLRTGPAAVAALPALREAQGRADGQLKAELERTIRAIEKRMAPGDGHTPRRPPGASSRPSR
jgi:HEAT repeat protein